MTDGIKRDPEARVREDVWRDEDGIAYAYKFREHYRGERRLPWPTTADGDGVTEPPTMDEVWPGRKMMCANAEVVLTGAPPEWNKSTQHWEVTAKGEAVFGTAVFYWKSLTPITPTTRLTVETTDPDEVRRRLGEVGRVVEVDDE